MPSKIKLAVLLVVAVVTGAASAQPRPPYEWRDNARPEWCRHYDWRDFQRDMRECRGNDRCEYRVRRRAERCGLRG